VVFSEHQATAQAPAPKPTSVSTVLAKTPYTQHDLQQQIQYALAFYKSATGGKIGNWILCFAHAAEY
jgi:hypothetical protein